LAIHNLMRFYKHESCGQCTPCREGCGWIDRILTKIVEGKGSIEELDYISEIGSDITGNTICAFGDGAALPPRSLVRKYRTHMGDYILGGGQSQTRSLSVCAPAASCSAYARWCASWRPCRRLPLVTRFAAPSACSQP